MIDSSAFIKYITMNFFYKESFLLFSVASLSLYSAAVANECEDQYNVLTTADACTPLEGSGHCPASCQESLDILETACSVDGATISNEPYDPSSHLQSILFSLVDEPCNSTVADEILVQTDTTCQDRGALYQSTPVLFCDEDTVCSQFCKDVQDAFYDSCSAEDIITTKDPISKEMSSMSVSEVVKGAENYMGDACREYEKGKTFKTSSSDDASTTSSSSSPSSYPSKESSSGSLTSSSFAFSISIISFILHLVGASTFSP